MREGKFKSLKGQDMPSKRRGNGEGCITQRKDKRWQGYITLANGKRKSVSRKTRKEVVEKLDEYRLQQRQGLPVQTERITFGEYLDRWIENTKRLEWKPTTLDRNRGIVRKHIKPHIGNIQLSKLNEMHLDDLQTKLETDPDILASANTHRKVHRLINSVLRHARKRGKILSNPAEVSNRPDVPQTERPTLSQEQLKAFHKAVSGTQYEALFLLAALTGMRQGEVLALKWQDIDFDRGTVSVKRSLMWVSRHDFRLTEPKTAASKRTFPPHGLALKP